MQGIGMQKNHFPPPKTSGVKVSRAKSQGRNKPPFLSEGCQRQTAAATLQVLGKDTRRDQAGESQK
jgi:hypothetical protein